RPQRDKAARPPAASGYAAVGQVLSHLPPSWPGEWPCRIAAPPERSRRETPPPWTVPRREIPARNRAFGPAASARFPHRVRYTRQPARRKRTLHHYLARL